MSLETLLEAARYVEQQELLAKQIQATAVVVAPVHQKPIAQPVAPIPPPKQIPITQKQDNRSIPFPETIKSAAVIVTQPVLHHPAVNGVDEKPAVGLQQQQPPQSQPEDSHDKKRQVLQPSLRSGTREVHNKLEKNRRAHLKECFEILKKQLPPQQDEKKSSNLSILHSALRYIQVLKKKERVNEHEMERLARDKIAAQQRLAALKKELGSQLDNVDLSNLLAEPIVSSTPVKEETTTVVAAATAALVPNELEEPGRVSSQQPQQPPIQPAQLSVHLPLSQVGYPVGQGLVVGLHKVALVSKSLPLVSSPVAHIITAPPNLNGKVVPLVNAQYLMKPVVVVSTASAAATAISPRPS